MGRDDTFPLPEDKIRTVFREMTTTEAEYHAETMWPYYNVKIIVMIEEKMRLSVPLYAKDAAINVISDLMDLNLSAADAKTKMKSIFTLIRRLASLHESLSRICLKCIIPWTLAAGAGLAGLLLKESFPVVAQLLEKIKQVSGQ